MTTTCLTAEPPSPRVTELVAKFENHASQAQLLDQGDNLAMNRASKDRLDDGDSSSSSSSEGPQSEEPRVLPRAVSAEDGALKKAALQVQKDLAGVEIPEVTSTAALSAAATASIRSDPLAAGQLQTDAPAFGTEQPAAPEPSRLSSAVLRALDAETAAQGLPDRAPPPSLAVQTPGSRRGTGDSVAEPLPSSAYTKRGLPTNATLDSPRQQPSRFAKPQGPASYSEDSESVASDTEPMPTSARGAAPSGKAASRMRTESDVSQDNGDNTPSSARPLLQPGPSSSALAAAPGSVTVSPKGSVVGFMPMPAGQHPLQSGDYEMMVSHSCHSLLQLIQSCSQHASLARACVQALLAIHCCMISVLVLDSSVILHQL